MSTTSNGDLAEYYPHIRLADNHQLKNDRRDTTKTEARSYYNALMEAVPFRVILLLSWHREHYNGEPEADLRRIGKKVADYVCQDHCYFTEDKVIGEGAKQIEIKDSITMYYHAQSMLIDMGFFLAVLLNQLDPANIRWELITTGAKRGRNYHQAVINGPSWLEFNPITQSGSGGPSLIRGSESYNFWAEYYLMWTDVLAGREPRSLANV